MSTVFIILLVILLIFVGIILFVNIGIRFALFTASTFIDIIKSPASLILIMCFIVLAILGLLINQKSTRASSYAPSSDIPVATEYKRSLPENKRTHFNTSETNTPTRETQEEPIYIEETPEFNTSETNTSTRETQEEPIYIEDTPEQEPIMDLVEEVPNTGVVYDAQGNEYKTQKIGDHVWTMQNLKLKTPSGSACYKNQQANCDKYGRYYTWAMAMVSCPSGWHLPNKKEWKNLLDNHPIDWSVIEPSMMTGGRNYKGEWNGLGSFSYYWTSDAGNAGDETKGSIMFDFNSHHVMDWVSFPENGLQSVRCVQD